jgi:integrase-like protein
MSAKRPVIQCLPVTPVPTTRVLYSRASPKHKDFGFQRSARPEQPDQGAPDQPAKIAHQKNYRPLASTCSTPSSSSGWPGEFLSGSTSRLIRPRTGSHARSRRLPWNEAPRYLIRDRDRVYGAAVMHRLRAMGIRDKPIAPGSPWQNGFAERLIGSIRREYVDHVVALGEAHLRRVLQAYAPLLQRCENPPIVRQGRALLAPGSVDRTHHIACAAGRTASLLLQNLVFGTCSCRAAGHGAQIGTIRNRIGAGNLPTRNRVNLQRRKQPR